MLAAEVLVETELLLSMLVEGEMVGFMVVVVEVEDAKEQPMAFFSLVLAAMGQMEL
jgi:hypothetical protein